MVPARFACRGGGVVTEGGGRGCYDGEEGMEPGSGVSRFRHYMGAVSGWECCDGEEGSRGLDGQFERAFALLLLSLHGCGATSAS